MNQDRKLKRTPDLGELFGLWGIFMILIGMIIEILFHPETVNHIALAKLAQIFLGALFANISTYNLERKRDG